MNMLYYYFSFPSEVHCQNDILLRFRKPAALKEEKMLSFLTGKLAWNRFNKRKVSYVLKIQRKLSKGNEKVQCYGASH